MFGELLTLARRAVENLSDIAAALERIAILLENAEPKWRRLDDVRDKEEILVRGQ
jgi:hypothetical protein